MLFTKEDIFMRDFVVKNKSLFEQVARAHVYENKNRDKKFSQLNYKNILNDMIEFLNGYIEYKEKDTQKYTGKVVGTAKAFYDSMFDKSNTKYRKKIYLAEMKDSYTDFLQGTKNLQKLMEDNIDRANRDPEFRILMTMTNNQYRKISKVCRDDMQIYLWLSTADTIYKYDIQPKLRADFVDDNTPVIHPAKIKADDINKYGESGPDDE